MKKYIAALILLVDFVLVLWLCLLLTGGVVQLIFAVALILSVVLLAMSFLWAYEEVSKLFKQ